MIDAEPQQMSLFADFEPSSRSDASSSPLSSEHTTSSNGRSPSTPSAAIAITPTRRASATSQAGTAASAESAPSGAASSTEASALQLRLWTNTAPKNTEASMLAVPRPKTLAECGQEARPCPWVGCRHHLALEVASPNVAQRKDPRATTLRLNMPRRGMVREGRRPGLASSAAHEIVRAWIDEATELLSRMRYTCTFDVVRDFPDGLSSGQIALVLGVTEQATDKELRRALIGYRAAMRNAHEEAIT